MTDISNINYKKTVKQQEFSYKMNQQLDCRESF